MIYSQSSNLLNSSRLKTLKAREDHIVVVSCTAHYFRLDYVVNETIKHFGRFDGTDESYLCCVPLPSFFVFYLVSI